MNRFDCQAQNFGGLTFGGSNMASKHCYAGVMPIGMLSPGSRMKLLYPIPTGKLLYSNPAALCFKSGSQKIAILIPNFTENSTNYGCGWQPIRILDYTCTKMHQSTN